MVKDAMHRERKTMKQVLNDVLREALERSEPAEPAYVVPVHHAQLRPGFDPTGLNRLADDLEDEALMRRASQ